MRTSKASTPYHEWAFYPDDCEGPLNCLRKEGVMIRFASLKDGPGSSVENKLGDGKAEGRRSFGDGCSHQGKEMGIVASVGETWIGWVGRR